MRNPKRKQRANCISSSTGQTGETFEAFIRYLVNHKPLYIFCEMVACRLVLLVVFDVNQIVSSNVTWHLWKYTISCFAENDLILA